MGRGSRPGGCRRASVLGAGLALVACGGAEQGPLQELTRPRSDLLARPDAWRSLAGAAPRVDVITPSIDNLTDAADRTALVLVPPAVVELVVAPGDGEGWIHPAAGVDLALARRLLAKVGPEASLAIDFELAHNGERIAALTVETFARAPQNDGASGLEPHVWHPLAGERGLFVRPGDRLRLSTSLPRPAPAGCEGALLAGVAGLGIEERFSVPRASARAGAPNVLLVVVDTQRRDRSSAYGYGRETTPNLERLAARGLAYDAAYATSSWTWPSTASLLTGRQPEAHGVVDFRSCWLEDELATLAESLQEAGFTTGAFSANPLVSAHRNFDQGFETFVATPDCAKGDAIVPPALEWLTENRARRFFLYLHLHDPHVPHRPRAEDLLRFTGASEPRYDPLAMQARTMELRNRREHTQDDRPRPELVIPPEEARWYTDVYDACVASADYWFGVVLDTLEELGLAENTLVAATSDHGEELLDHGMLNHNHALWQELVAVPLVLAGPGIPRGERVALPVSNRHLAPTLARLAGVPFPAPDDFQDLAAPAALDARPIFFDTRHGWWKGRQFVDVFGVLQDGWVLHWCPEGRPWDAPAGGDPGRGEERLFELASDPLEQSDRSLSEPERAAALRGAILRELARLAPERPKTKRRAGEATLEVLRGAGYAGGDDER